MLEAAVVGLLVACPLVGAVTRRWLAVLLPVVAWPVFYVGLNENLWLDGTGDGWPLVAGLLLLFGTATTAVAVAVSRTLKPADGGESAVTTDACR
jgi:hypothetical protein